MATTYPKIFKVGTQSSYNNLGTYDDSVLYFCKDSGKIYKGAVDFSNNIIMSESKASVTTPVAGKLYYFIDTKSFEAYVSGDWKIVSYPIVTSIGVDSDDDHLPTAKAVYDAIADAVSDVTGGSTVVKSVEVSETDGKIKITKGDNTTSEVAIKGAVTSPEWNSDTRKLTLHVVDGNDVEVNIGKDVYIDPTAPNGYNDETKTIDLYLNDGKGDHGTKVSIPASSLIDIYTGEATNSTSVTVTDDKKVKVDIKIDSTIENNGIVVTENGIKVDLSAYAKSSDVGSQVTALQSSINTVTATANANSSAITILNGDSTVEGSIDKKIATATGAISSEVNGVKSSVGTCSEKVDALIEATTKWGTF